MSYELEFRVMSYVLAGYGDLCFTPKPILDVQSAPTGCNKIQGLYISGCQLHIKGIIYDVSPQS